MLIVRNIHFWAAQLVVISAVFIDASRETVVSTKNGIVMGETDIVHFNGESRYVQRFLGIPYAKPPTGLRRFSRPEPFGDFSQPYNATFHRPQCLQTTPLYYKHLEDFERSEDCLYLNVFVPGNMTSRDVKHAVMIYFHGGSFTVGGADIHSGDILASFNDVIIVTINYRLNVFGFLSNGTKSSGNFGLWDMRMAIQWVHDHISVFGGDTNRVTLFGNSAGGAAVLYQAMYPGNRGLFHRIIAQSGSIFAPWAMQKDPSKYYRKYVKDIGCDAENYDTVHKCLLDKQPQDLKVSSWEFIPSVDGDFVLQEPSELFSQNSLYGLPAREVFAEIDLLNGVTSSDGAMNIPTWTEVLESGNIDIDSGVPRKYFEDVFVPAGLRTMFGKVSNIIKQSVIHEYTDWTRPEDALVVRNKLIQFASDVTFFVPAVIISKNHGIVQGNSTKSKSFFYVFNHKPSFVPEPDWLKGATHTMEVPYIFGLHESLEGKLVEDLNAVDPFTVTEEDVKLSRILMTMWSNFAKSGDPNIPEDVHSVAVDWPTYDIASKKYLELSTNITSLSVKNHLAAPRVAFWNDLVPVLEECNLAQVTSNCPGLNYTYLFVLVVCFSITTRFLIFL